MIAERTRAGEQRSKVQRDRGFSTVEIVAAISLLGIGGAAILFALLALVTSSSVHRDEVSRDFMLKTAAEQVLSMQTPYVDCATTGSYDAVLPTDPDGRVDVSVVAVEVWNGASPPVFQSGCSVDSGATKITLEARAVDSSAADRLEIVKRRSGS